MEGIQEEEKLDKLKNPHQILPAYEEVKRNILIFWVQIQVEFEKYIRITSRNAYYPSSILASKLISLYATMLREKFKKDKDFKDFVVEMDGYWNKAEIPEKKINHVVQEFSRWMEKGGITNISFEAKPWEERFSDSYPV